MSGEPLDVVRAFFEQVNRDGSVAAFDRRLGRDVVWENSGAPACHGRDACIAFNRAGAEALGYRDWTAELRGLAADGDVVLTDRLDNLIAADGSVRASVAVMGALRVADGRIVEWREYFDPAPLAELAVSARPEEARP